MVRFTLFTLPLLALLCMCSPRGHKARVADDEYMPHDTGSLNPATDPAAPGWQYWELTDAFYYDGLFRYQESLLAFAPGFTKLWDDDAHDNLVPVMKNGRYGFTDTNGVERIPCLYDYASLHHNNLIAVMKAGRWGVLSSRNKVLVPLAYEAVRAEDLLEGILPVMRDKKWGFSDTNGHIVIPMMYGDVKTFSEGLCLACEANDQVFPCGYIDRSNRRVIPFRYSSHPTERFVGGFAVVDSLGKRGMIDRQGRSILPLRLAGLNHYHEGYAAAWIDSTDAQQHSTLSYFCYVDTAGRLTESFEPFSYQRHPWILKRAPKALPYCPVHSGGEDVYGFGDNIRAMAQLKGKRHRSFYADKGYYTLENVLAISLNAIVNEPYSYPDLDALTEISVAYGLGIGGGNYTPALIGSNEWDCFRQSAYRIMGSERLRRIAWKWIRPYYREAFGKMNPFHRETYRNIARHLRAYINAYDVEATYAYLQQQPARFAHYDADGTRNPNRKLCAFVDRLILVHKVVSVEDAKRWINRIADEVAQW